MVRERIGADSPRDDLRFVSFSSQYLGSREEPTIWLKQ